MGTEQWTAAAAACLGGLLSGVCLTGLRTRPDKERPAPVRLLICLLLWADVTGLLLLEARCFRLGAAGTAAVSALAAAAAWFLPLPILPEDGDILLSVEKGQRRELLLCILADLLVLTVLGAWFGWQLFRGAVRTEGVFSALFLLLGLTGCHCVCLRVQERFEALVDRQYQQELLSFMQIIRSQRHDFSFHMNTVAGMIERREYERCQEYVQRMVRHAASLNEVLPLADPAVSALLNTFSAIAQEKDIRLELQLLDPVQDPPCTAYELNTMIGNLMQNALDEAERHDGDRRWIRLLILRRGRKYFIKVSNPCDTPPEDLARIFETGYTTKHSHEGIGLVTVKRIAGKLGGSVTLEHEPGVIHFVVHLPVRQLETKNRRNGLFGGTS